MGFTIGDSGPVQSFPVPFLPNLHSSKTTSESMTELGKVEMKAYGSLTFSLSKIEMMVLGCHFVLSMPLCSH